MNLNSSVSKHQSPTLSGSSLRSGHLQKKLELATQQLVSASSSSKHVTGSKRATGKTPNAEQILQQLEDVADYDSEQGGFIVHTQPAYAKSYKVGKRLANLNTNEYLVIQLKRVVWRQSHLVWLWHHGSWPEFHIDHVNGVRDDDRIENLRDVPQRINNCNRKLQSNNKTGITGISFESVNNKYRVRADHNGKSVSIGSFTTLLEAARALAAFHEECSDLGYTARHLQSLHRYLAAQLFANGDIR